MLRGEAIEGFDGAFVPGFVQGPINLDPSANELLKVERRRSGGWRSGSADYKKGLGAFGIERRRSSRGGTRVMVRVRVRVRVEVYCLSLVFRG